MAWLSKWRRPLDSRLAKYRGYRINLVSYYNSDRDGWVPAARMSKRAGGTRFAFTRTGEPIICPTREAADSTALEWGKDWINNRPD